MVPFSRSKRKFPLDAIGEGRLRSVVSDWLWGNGTTRVRKLCPAKEETVRWNSSVSDGWELK
jgi:hypothetical protein